MPEKGTFQLFFPFSGFEAKPGLKPLLKAPQSPADVPAP